MSTVVIVSEVKGLRRKLGSVVSSFSSSSDSLDVDVSGCILDLRLEISHGSQERALSLATAAASATGGEMVSSRSLFGRPALGGRWFHGGCWMATELQGLGLGRQFLLRMALGNAGGGGMPRKTFK